MMLSLCPMWLMREVPPSHPPLHAAQNPSSVDLDSTFLVLRDLMTSQATLLGFCVPDSSEGWIQASTQVRA